MFLLDSNVIIDYLNDKLPEKGIVFLEKILVPQISVVTRIELSILPNASSNHLKIVNQYLSYCKIFDLSDDVVLKVIEIRKKYKIRDFDSIIAATALVKNLTIITNDKDFNNIKKLKVINLYKLS